MNELFNIDITQLSYGALFVWLLFDTNKKNEQRESKYQEIINNLTESINVIQDVKEDVEEIKNKIIKGNSPSLNALTINTQSWY